MLPPRNATWLVTAAFAAGILPAAAGPPAWVELKSPAFTVVSDGGEKDARYVALQFEQVRALLRPIVSAVGAARPEPADHPGGAGEGGLSQLLPDFREQRAVLTRRSCSDRARPQLGRGATDVARVREPTRSGTIRWWCFIAYVHVCGTSTSASCRPGSTRASPTSGAFDGRGGARRHRVPRHRISGATLRERGVLPLQGFVVGHGSADIPRTIARRPSTRRPARSCTTRVWCGEAGRAAQPARSRSWSCSRPVRPPRMRKSRYSATPRCSAWAFELYVS